MKLSFLFLLCLVVKISVLAQISGNHVYNYRYQGNNNEATPAISVQPVIVKDSIMLISAAVLLNAKADSLIVTLGLSQEARTVTAANAAINSRIAAFKAKLKLMGLAENDAYIDFITQTKVYDYTVAGTNATQFIKGFEIKKNVIVRMAASGVFEKVIEAASEEGIYDIVKVDYLQNGTQKIYAEIMAAAASVIKQKKDVYLLLSPLEILPVPKLLSETFYAVYPDSRYKEYQAFETSDVSADYNNAHFIKKEERKAKTFYYDKIDQSTFDLVLNNSLPVVGLQYVLKIQVQYDLKRR